MSSKEVVFVGDDVIVVTSGCAINSYTFMSEATSELGCQELTPNRVSLAINDPPENCHLNVKKLPKT